MAEKQHTQNGLYNQNTVDNFQHIIVPHGASQFHFALAVENFRSIQKSLALSNVKHFLAVSNELKTMCFVSSEGAGMCRPCLRGEGIMWIVRRLGF